MRSDNRWLDLRVCTASRSAEKVCFDLPSVPKRSLSKYAFRASEMRTTASPDRAETGLEPWFFAVRTKTAKSSGPERIGLRRAIFWPFPRRASQQVCPKNPRQPATQRGGRSGGEHGSHRNWRRGCGSVQRVSRLEPWGASRPSQSLEVAFADASVVASGADTRRLAWRCRVMRRTAAVPRMSRDGASADRRCRRCRLAPIIARRSVVSGSRRRGICGLSQAAGQS